VQWATHPLVAGRQTVLVDLLGFGYSDPGQGFDYTLESHAASVARLLDHLGLRGPELVGYSMGGSIAILLAAQRPDLVSRLVVIEGNLDPGIGSLSKVIAEQSEEDYLRVGHARIVAEWRTFFPTHAGAICLVDPRAMYWSAVGLITGSKPTMREHFLALTMPRVFIAGEKSLPEPSWDSLPDAGIQFLVVPNGSHAMMVDNPDGFAEVLATALAG
jgi:pimeloyl-ACP methyl ester carboxylesterase